MNQRNVDSLMKAIIAAVEREDYVSIFPEHFRNPKGTDIERLATRLANMGVLVPSMLTVEEANDVGRQQVHHMMVDNFDLRNAEAVRAELERIAKGEVHAEQE